jgi:hypothetical protein
MNEPTEAQKARIVANRLKQQARKQPSEKEKFRIYQQRIQREAEVNNSPAITGEPGASHGEAV